MNPQVVTVDELAAVLNADDVVAAEVTPTQTFTLDQLTAELRNQGVMPVDQPEVQTQAFAVAVSFDGVSIEGPNQLAIVLEEGGKLYRTGEDEIVLVHSCGDIHAFKLSALVNVLVTVAKQEVGSLPFEE